MAEESNKSVINEIINPTPSLIVDEAMNIDNQIDYKNNDLDTTFKSPDSLQKRLDNVLDLTRKKANSVKFTVGKPTEEILNDPLSSEKSDIKTEDFFIDYSYSILLKDGNFFPQPSTDDRKDFEVKVGRDDLIVYKSPTLTTVNIARKDFKNLLENIIEDLNLNISQLKTDTGSHDVTIKKIDKIKKFINEIDFGKKDYIEKQFNSSNWISKLIDEQLQQKKNYYTFGSNFENYKRIENQRKERNRKPYAKVTTRKRKLLPIVSEERLKDLPAIYTQIPTDRAKKIEAAKQVFDKIIKQVPPESFKKFKVNYDEKNNITIHENSDDESV